MSDHAKTTDELRGSLGRMTRKAIRPGAVPAETLLQDSATLSAAIDELSCLRAENQRLTAPITAQAIVRACVRLCSDPEGVTLIRHALEMEQRATAAERDLKAEMDGALSLREQYGARDSETMFDFIARLYSGACRADAAETALPALRERCARLADELERTGRRMPNHACRECVPFSEILVDGFQCAYHAAIRAIPIEVKT